MGIANAGRFQLKQRTAKSWEELRALDGFRPIVDRDELVKASLVGEYEMSQSAPMQPCGIRQCKTPHRKGFIVELGDHVISHVGGHCGKKHFGAISWKARLRNYRDAAREQAKAEAQSQLRRRAEVLLSNVMNEPSELKEVRVMLSAFDRLPQEIKDSVVSKAQDGISEIIRSRAPNEKEIAEAKFHQQRVPIQIEETIGRLEGIRAVLPSRRADVIFDVSIPDKLNSVRKALGGSSERLDQAMRGYHAAIGDLERAVREAFVFFSNANISQLSLLPSARRVGVKSISTRADPWVIEIS